jgi:hypothetical protein
MLFIHPLLPQQNGMYLLLQSLSPPLSLSHIILIIYYGIIFSLSDQRLLSGTISFLANCKVLLT